MSASGRITEVGFRAFRAVFDPLRTIDRSDNRPLGPALIIAYARIERIGAGLAMKRREFLTLVGGGAVGWPFAAQAQQPERMRRIAVLMPFSENDPEVRARFAAFKQRLKDLGWTDGRNVQIDHRFTDENTERIRIGAGELVAVAPDVIVVYANSATAALRQATRVIPIVFAQVSDPVGSGFVASLARPGGNISGFQNFETAIGGKWLEVLKQIAPGVRRAAVI